VQIIKQGTKLRVIGRAGAGVDNIDTVAATRRGIIVMNTPGLLKAHILLRRIKTPFSPSVSAGGNTSAAAELTMSLLMSTARQIPAACAALKGGVWDRKTYANGVELKGKTIGVVGLGMIGNEVARRCQALDMVTIGFDPLVTDEKAAASGVKKVSLDALFASADIITVHTPMNEATKNLLNKATLAKCKKGVIVINCARGGIVNEADLLEALNSGQVGAAALDVFDQEPPSATSKALISHPKVSDYRFASRLRLQATFVCCR
jgi:D-3-phosphoglycerate dehydrogenase